LLGKRSSSQNNSVCVKTKSNNFLIPPVARIYKNEIKIKNFDEIIIRIILTITGSNIAIASIDLTRIKPIMLKS
jgi:hypothetical protein